MGKRTPLFAVHRDAGAKMVDFAGWDMPLHYGSQIEEHHQVRRDAGVFDVSHMLVVDVTGAEAEGFLRHLLANDVARLNSPGKALYSCMLNAAGGVVDDLIVYRRQGGYRMVVNAGTREKDLAWMERQCEGFDAALSARADLAMLAVQGPSARERVHRALGERVARAWELKRFQGVEVDGWFIARTGYTGEDGYEIMVPAAAALALWQALIDAGVAPVGLGARDTLRLEAGMNLYGQDMDEHTSPLVSGLAWTVAWEPAERDFVGRTALEAERASGPQRRLVGLVLEGRGVLRPHQRVYLEDGEGEITSGSFSPTLGGSIALARVPVGQEQHCSVEVRGRRLPARIVRPPFVRNGRAAVE